MAGDLVTSMAAWRRPILVGAWLVVLYLSLLIARSLSAFFLADDNDIVVAVHKGLSVTIWFIAWRQMRAIRKGGLVGSDSWRFLVIEMFAAVKMLVVALFLTRDLLRHFGISLDYGSGVHYALSGISAFGIVMGIVAIAHVNRSVSGALVKGIEIVSLAIAGAMTIAAHEAWINLIMPAASATDTSWLMGILLPVCGLMFLWSFPFALAVVFILSYCRLNRYLKRQEE